MQAAGRIICNPSAIVWTPTEAAGREVADGHPAALSARLLLGLFRPAGLAVALVPCALLCWAEDGPQGGAGGPTAHTLSTSDIGLAQIRKTAGRVVGLVLKGYCAVKKVQEACLVDSWACGNLVKA